MGYGLAKILRGTIEKKIHALEPRAVLDPKDFPWARDVQKFHSEIKSEVLKLLPNLDKISNFDDILPNQRALYQKNSWKSFFLIALGKDVKTHQTLCPVTTQALTHIPGMINAFYSILRPDTHIPPHRGPYAGILRYHLGIIIPEGDVAIRVDQEICRWKDGEGLFFDDSFEHEAWNKTNSLRVILFVDLERPLPLGLSLFNKFILSIFKVSKTVRIAQARVQGTQVTAEF